MDQLKKFLGKKPSAPAQKKVNQVKPPDDPDTRRKSSQKEKPRGGPDIRREEEMLHYDFAPESDSNDDTPINALTNAGDATKPQISINPPRGTAFQAPLVHLPVPSSLEDPEAEDQGLNFTFEPKANYRTEISFTVEPRKTPNWATMMRCGFVPMIPCQVPPYSIGNYVSHPLTIQNHPVFHYPAPNPPHKKNVYEASSSEEDDTDSETSSSSSSSYSETSSEADSEDEE